MSKQTLFQKLRSEKRFEEADINRHSGRTFAIKIIIMTATVAVCAFFFTYHIDRRYSEPTDHTFVPGYIWQGQTLKADFTFPIYKQEDVYLEEVARARENAPMVFLRKSGVRDNAISILSALGENLPTLTINSQENQLFKLSENALAAFIPNSPIAKQRLAQDLEFELIALFSEIYKYGYINLTIDRLNLNTIIARVSPTSEIRLNKSYLVDRTGFQQRMENFLARKTDNSTRDIARELILRLGEPDLIFNKDLTEQAADLEGRSVSRTIGIVRKGSIIIEKGEPITQNAVLILQSYQTSQNIRSENFYTASFVLGSLGHAALVYSILIMYLVVIRRQIFGDNAQLGLLSSLMSLVSAFGWVSMEFPSSFPLEYLIPLPAFSMLVAIVFDSRTAFYTTVTMSLMLAGVRGNDYITGASMMFAGILASYTVRDIQNRTQIFRSIFFIFIGFATAIVVFGLERSTDLTIVAKRGSLTLINSALSPLITFGMLFILERLTNIATDLRIKEFDNLDHPLLVKMNESAPGTYQHTLAVALLAERCAQAINANPLLAKVGAYFHDIGKIAKAEYFTENQLNIGNKHDRLSPKKSAQAIKEHVIDGIELAEQYKLPRRIVEFIPMHHGTTLIKHFYAKALEDNPNPESIREEDFRYPGPKPRTKETAILMICDSSEALSRVQADDNEQFDKIIQNNIRERILDGQFDECPITLAELSKIRSTIVKNLLGKSHPRLKYKEIPTAGAKPV
ncbi:MAG: HD family phosphohydrolase [Chloroflexota bacterium]